MGTERICRVRGLDIKLDLESTEEGGETRNYELWRAGHFDHKEPDTLDWIDACVKPGDVFYDIGANIGQYSLYAAARLGGEIRAFAFEPEALNFAKLNKNVVLNAWIDTIVPYPLAIADTVRLDTFYSKAFVEGAALHTLGRSVTQGEVPFESQNRQGTMAVNIDALWADFGLPFPTHIKVDVDGIEGQIVAGAERTLRDARLRTFLIEVFMHGDIAEQIRTRFEAANMALSNEADVDFTQGRVSNLIFVRE